MQLPFTDQQCFFVAILVFMVFGFRRGWRRELVSLVFVLLAVFLIKPNTSDYVGGFLARLPGIVAYLTNAQPQPVSSSTGFLAGPFWSLVFFVGLVALGYYVGNRVFPKPSTPQERLIGIIPAIISGAFVLSFLGGYIRTTSGGRSNININVQPPDPTSYIPIIFVIVIVAIVAALIVSRARKAPAKK
jgi:ABC-type polysaccharide/polyol phosphate export permease